jgi:hypothetical protein
MHSLSTHPLVSKIMLLPNNSFNIGFFNMLCMLQPRELEEMSKGENIVKWINGQRINWLGHLEGMEEDRMPKKIFTQELEGTKRRGRPRKGWREEI